MLDIPKCYVKFMISSALSFSELQKRGLSMAMWIFVTLGLSRHLPLPLAGSCVQWKSWAKASPLQITDAAVALLLMFRTGVSRGDAYHALPDRNWLCTNKSVSVKGKNVKNPRVKSKYLLVAHKVIKNYIQITEDKGQYNGLSLILEIQFFGLCIKWANNLRKY